MKFKVMYWKLECRKDIHYKTQTGTSCEKCNSKAFQLGIQPASSGLCIQCSLTIIWNVTRYNTVGALPQ